MAASRQTYRPRTNARKKNSKLKRFLIVINPFTPRRRLVTFVAIFALIGGYFVYRSFAAVNTPTYYLRHSNTPGNGETNFAFGNPGDQPIACDWDGNRSDGIGVWQTPSTAFHLSDMVNPTKVTKIIPFGNQGDKPVCGDWNGDRKAGVGVYRNGVWYLADNINNAASRETSAAVTKEIKWGNPGDIPLVCDWNGDGKDDIGLYRPSNAHFYLSYSTLGWTDQDIHFGNGGDLPVCGNWDGIGADGIGVYRPSNATYYLSDTTQPTRVNYQFVYGNPGDKPIVGDWDGNGTTTVGITRMGDIPSKPAPANNELRAPMEGPAVTSLQQRLAGRGFWIAATGKYDYATETTVKWFQAVRRLPATGRANQATMDQLAAAEREGWRFNPNDPLLAPLAQPVLVAKPPATTPATPTLQLGASGPAVASLQQRLANRGFWIGVSGNFDQATNTTVRWFQAVRRLPATGRANQATMDQLAAAEREGWRFNPNDPLLTPIAAPQPVVVNPGTGGPQNPGPQLTPELIAFLEALKRAEEEQARRDAPPAPVSVPRTLPVGYCELWRQRAGQWILVDTRYVIVEHLCANLHNLVSELHHIDWVGPDGKRKEVWTKPNYL